MANQVNDKLGVPITYVVSNPSNTVEYTTPSGPNRFGAYGPSTSEIDLAWTDNSNGAFGFIIDRTGNWQLPFAGSLGFLLIGALLAPTMHPERAFQFEVERLRR